MGSEWTPQKDLSAIRRAEEEKRERKSAKIVSFVLVTLLVSFVLVTLLALTGVTSSIAFLFILVFFYRSKQWKNWFGKKKTFQSNSAKAPLTDRQRQLLGLPPMKYLYEREPVTPVNKVQYKLNLADIPTTFSGVSDRKQGMKSPISDVKYEESRSGDLEGDGQVSTPEQLDAYLRTLKSTLDSDVNTVASPTGIFGSPMQSLSDNSYSYSITPAPTLPPYRASPQPSSAAQSPTTKSLASTLEVLERFLEGIGMTVTQLEQSEDTLRQWIAENIVHTLIDRIENVHKDIERIAAQPGAACPTNVVPPPVNVLPLFMCPSISTLDVKDREREQYLDKNQLEKWHEVLNSQLSTQQGYMAPSYDPAKKMQLIQLIQDYLGLLSLMEGKCTGAKELIAPFPKGYLFSRLYDLARGGCMKELRWNSGRSHLANKKWNANEFPTDSALMCYLFCAYLKYPKWQFVGKNQQSTPRTSLFVGILPHKPGDFFRAILPQISVPKNDGAIILFQSRYGNPVYSVVMDGREQIRLSGHSGVFRGIALFLKLLYLKDHGWIGAYRFHKIGLSRVVEIDDYTYR